MCWQSSVNNAENSMWHNRAPMFWHAIHCVAVPAYFECVHKVASIISVKEREREKRSSVEELLALPFSSLVSVISFDCQLAFRNANSEKQSIHSNSITFLQSQMSKNQLGAKDGMSRKVRNLSPVIKKFIFSQLFAFLTGCSLLDLEPNTWRLLRRFLCAFLSPFLSFFRSWQLG